MPRLLAVLVAVALTALAAALPAAARDRGDRGDRGSSGQSRGDRPGVIALPNGFRPEGIAAGRGSRFFVGSIPTGAIYAGDVRTGRGAVLVPGGEGRAAIGLEYDRRRDRLFVAGGPTGRAFVYDARTGAELARFQLTTGDAFVNDVVVTRRAAYFTDSRQQRLYVLPLGQRGALPAAATTLPLTGALTYDADPATIDANGIETTPDRRALLVVQSRTGLLFRVDPATGATTQVAVSGGDLVSGDGLLRTGRTLLVVQNRLNRVAALRVSRDGTTAAIRTLLADPDFDVPTTIAIVRGALYAVNARFGTPPAPDTPYSVVRVDGRSG